MKLQIKDKIGVTGLRNLNEAKNLALLVELMLQEHNTRYAGGRRRYVSDVANGTKTGIEKNKNIMNKSGEANTKRNEKAEGKKPMESKGV